jgi:hypothetical protein
MKRDVTKRMIRTFWQAALGGGAVAAEEVWRTGEFGWASAAFVVAAAIAAGASAVQNALDNRERAGEMVED